MFKLVFFCALATLGASKPTTLIGSGTSSITTEEKTEIRHHVPLTQVHLGSAPTLKTAEILTPTAEIVQPAAVSTQYTSVIHKPILKTAEIITPSTKIVQPYLNIIPGVVSHQFNSDLHSAPILNTEKIESSIKTETIETKPSIELRSAPGLTHSTKTEIISKPLLKTSSIIGLPLTESHVIAAAPFIQRAGILEHAPVLLNNAEISHSYVESTKKDYIAGPHAVVGYTPLSKIPVAPYAGFGADPLLIPSIGAAEYLIHQPLRYL